MISDGNAVMYWLGLIWKPDFTQSFSKIHSFRFENLVNKLFEQN